MAKVFALVVMLMAPNALAKTTADIDIRLSCPVQGVFIDRTPVVGQATEELSIKAKQFSLGNKKADKSQMAWMTDSKITSNKKVYEASLIANGLEYAIVAYGDLVKEGISGSVLALTYHIDLKTFRFRRIITFFPAGKDISSEGVCKKI